METIGKTQHQRALSTSDAKDLSRWRHDARTGGSGPLAPDRQGEFNLLGLQDCHTVHGGDTE